jgi:GDP-L-fucose synthase
MGDAMRTWADRRVLVTGGSGFLGSYLVERLRARGGAQVVAPRRRDYDLVDGTAVRRLFAETRPDVVFHLAALVGGIGANQANPAAFFYANAMMGIQVIHEAWRAGVGKCVVMGTICAYPKVVPVPFREDDLWAGYPEETNAPYGVAKRMLLVQAQAYRRQYGFNAIFVMPTNLYGPRDHFEPERSHVIPALMAKCLDARDRGEDRIVVWGDGSATREFLYVEDAAEGLVLAAERYDEAEPVNLGSGREISIADLAHLTARLTGFTGRIEWDTSKPNGQPRRRVDVSRARAAFGFEATTSLEDGLSRTVAWYEATRSVTPR